VNAASTLERDALMPRPPEGMGRGLGLAVLVHLGLIAALAVGVNWRRSEPQGMEAELWSAVPQVAAPRAVEPPPPPPPPPEPKPRPRVEQPQPAQQAREAQIAVEKERERKQKLKAQQEEAEKAGRQREEQRKKAEAEKKAEADKKDAERKKRERLEAEQKRLDAERERNLQEIIRKAGGGPGTSPGTAAQSSGPSAGYAGRIKARVLPNIVFTETTTRNPVAEVEVRLSSDGRILSTRLLKPSGMPAWDDAVLRAVERTEQLPRDVDGRVPSTMVLTFSPNER
jgi:colicin import membrane protein